MKNIFKHLLYGNYFYGLCAVALSIETSIIQHVPFLKPSYYLIIFLSTVFYYTSAYVELNDYTSDNPRTNWYNRNNKLIKLIQSAIFLLVILLCTFYFININNVFALKYSSQLLLLFIFPITGFLYYLNLRSIGLLKPFFIAFTWSGIVSIYPIAFSSIERGLDFYLSISDLILFINNTMYILILCILFDIKDYSADYNKSVKTIVVKYGLRNTIFFICIPLCLLGLGTFILYGVLNEYSILKLIIISVPFLLMFWAIYSLKNRRSIIFYLFYIDGLMFVKAICGIIALNYLK